MVYKESIKLKLKTQEIGDITGDIENIVRKSEIEDGICNVFVVGATGSLIINENEIMLLEDFKKVLEKISDSKDLYQHVENAYSHIKSMLIGNSQTIPVRKGELLLGAWQNVMIVNFDSKDREREVIVTVIGD